MDWLTNLLGKISYKRETLTTDSIQFDTSGWKLRRSSNSEKLWLDECGNALTLYYVHKPPDIPPLSDFNGLVGYCREIASGDGDRVSGIISVDVIDAQGIPALRTIYKYERLPAYGYTGMLILPFRWFIFTITIAAIEHGTTGVRDAGVTALLAEAGELELELFDKPDSSGSVGSVKSWFQDPYDPNYKGHITRSISDDEKYDSLFPDHPLSKVRRTLDIAQNSLRCDERIYTALRHGGG